MQRESCMGANECRKYERNDKLLVCRHQTARGCSRVNEYREYERKYELLTCVSVMQREGAGTCCWHASALSVRAVGMCQHDTTQEHVSELVACVSVMQRRRVHFPLTLRTCFCCDTAES